MSGSRDKKIRREVRRTMRASGLTQDNFQRQVMLNAVNLVAEALRPRPRFVPVALWRWFVLQVIDLEALGLRKRDPTMTHTR